VCGAVGGDEAEEERKKSVRRYMMDHSVWKIRGL
jgi:hypothetical protein